MLSAVLVMVVLAVAASGAAAFASRRRPDEQEILIGQIDALLPQTQCGRCTFTGCRPYATAIARGEADINQCPPGGDETAAALARLLGRKPVPVDLRFGVLPGYPRVAFIDEAACIGCTKCIQACPVDAIVGASKYMHTVIAADCTGCELCIPPCPVDCIEMVPAAPGCTPSLSLPRGAAEGTHISAPQARAHVPSSAMPGRDSVGAPHPHAAHAE